MRRTKRVRRNGEEQRKKRMTEKWDRKGKERRRRRKCRRRKDPRLAGALLAEARVYTMSAPAPPPSPLPLPTWCNTPRKQHRTQRMNGRQQAPLYVAAYLRTYVRTYASYIANADTYVTCSPQRTQRRGRFVDRCVTLLPTSLPTNRSPSLSRVPPP